jgi:hypothetical protein
VTEPAVKVYGLIAERFVAQHIAALCERFLPFDAFQQPIAPIYIFIKLFVEGRQQRAMQSNSDNLNSFTSNKSLEKLTSSPE